jgi:SAM-dependent methyltransferase
VTFYRYDTTLNTEWRMEEEPMGEQRVTPDVLDAHARDYYQTWQPDHFLEDRVQIQGFATYAEWLSGRVLQLGYGTGTMARLLARDHDLTVIEGSPLLAAHCRADGIPVAESMFEDARWGPDWDTVLAGHVLEHVDDPVTVIRMVAGWLRPGGAAVFVVPNADSLHRLLGEAMGFGSRFDLSPRDALVGHRRVYDLSSLRRDVAVGGLEVVEAFGFFVKSVPNAAMLGYPTELIDGLCALSWPAGQCANIGVVGIKP